MIPIEKLQSFTTGYSSVRRFSADIDGAVFQLGGIFLAVPGTPKNGGTFLAVMKYGGTDFGSSRYCEIWRYFSPSNEI